jgi:hypothetical protein
MKPTKELTVTWIPSNNPLEVYRANQERLIKLMVMELEGKTIHRRDVTRIDEHTRKRGWRDQEAVDEWIEFMQYLAKKYNGKMIIGELTNI